LGRVMSGRLTLRFVAAVVPTTSVQSATASATLSQTSALAKSSLAPTAERASRNEGSYGETSRNCEAPKFAMARATAPILSGLRVRTRMMHKSWLKQESAADMTQSLLLTGRWWRLPCQHPSDKNASQNRVFPERLPAHAVRRIRSTFGAGSARSAARIVAVPLLRFSSM